MSKIIQVMERYLDVVLIGVNIYVATTGVLVSEDTKVALMAGIPLGIADILYFRIGRNKKKEEQDNKENKKKKEQDNKENKKKY